MSSKTILICLLISGHSHAETASKRKPLTATEKLATEVNLYIHQFNKDQSSSNTAIGADTKTKRSIPLNARNYWNNKFHQTLVKLASSEINGQIETHDPHSAWDDTFSEKSKRTLDHLLSIGAMLNGFVPSSANIFQYVQSRYVYNSRFLSAPQKPIYSHLETALYLAIEGVSFAPLNYLLDKGEELEITWFYSRGFHPFWWLEIEENDAQRTHSQYSLNKEQLIHLEFRMNNIANIQDYLKEEILACPSKEFPSSMQARIQK